MSGKSNYELTTDYIPLDPGGVDFSLSGNRAILNQALQGIVDQVSNQMKARGLSSSDWTILSHNITHLGSGLIVSVLSVLNSGE